MTADWVASAKEAVATFLGRPTGPQGNGAKVYYVPRGHAKWVGEQVAELIGDYPVARVADYTFGSGSLGVEVFAALNQEQLTRIEFIDGKSEGWVNPGLSALANVHPGIHVRMGRPLDDFGQDGPEPARDFVIFDPTLTTQNVDLSPQRYLGDPAKIAGHLAAIVPRAGWLLLVKNGADLEATWLRDALTRVTAGYVLRWDSVKPKDKASTWSEEVDYINTKCYLVRLGDPGSNPEGKITWQDIGAPAVNEASENNPTTPKTLMELTTELCDALKSLCAATNSVAPAAKRYAFTVPSARYVVPNNVPLNVLFKGVPGTGKSLAVDALIEDLGIDPTQPSAQVLRINVHSASTNSQLMQGIGVSTLGGQITYSEKRGLVLNHLVAAIQDPAQPYVLVLEEVQENSLNALIGDLIYLIEPSKRLSVCDLLLKIAFSEVASFSASSLAELVAQLLRWAQMKGEHVSSVRLPTLVAADGQDGMALVFPRNLHVFCTANYRDDRKIVEDNLMRRFDVIEIPPCPEAIRDLDVRDVFKRLNDGLRGLDNTHGDRNELGHADWLEVDSPASMAKALLKALHEWKDIRGFPWEEIRENVLGIGKTASVAKKIESMYPVLDGHITKATSYSDAIRKLQAERYPRIIGRTGPLGSPATVLAPAESEVPVVA